MGNVRIVADSTCDLSPELIAEYDITVIPLCIVLDDVSYYDKEEISPEEIFAWADANKTTPKTAAPSIEKAMQILAPMMKEQADIVYLGISEEMSTTCNVIRLTAAEEEYTRLFVVDSMNLSTGIGLQVLRAARLAKSGMSAEEIVAIMESKRDEVRASFVVDTLTYLARGGRCTAVQALLANTLKLHPRIEVKGGKMGVGQKYRGNMKFVLGKYAKEMEEDLKVCSVEDIFITHSKVDDEVIQEIYDYLSSFGRFQNIHITRAGGVISSHCGPGTLGILYYMD